MKYTVTIEEIVAENFEVEANTAKEAIKIAREKYKSGNFVLEPGEVQDCKLSIMGSDNWEEM